MPPSVRQAEFNAASRDHWNAFAEHRVEVSRRLGAFETARSSGRLCVLGAGNANDLDLPALLDVHHEVHLVDLDARALALGVSRQGVEGLAGLRLFGGLDLTGMLETIARWSPRSPIEPRDLLSLVEAPPRLVAPALPGPYDRVASTCLLTQLIGNAFHSLGEGHPQFQEAVRAIREGHLRLLAGLTRPGGLVVLITDVVSSDTLPDLDSHPVSALPGLLPRLVRDRNFFHGVSPAILPALIEQPSRPGPRMTLLETSTPWRWNLHARVYLVWALTFRVADERSR